MLPAGRLRHRVTISELVVTLDSDDGAQSEDWTAVYENVPAEIVALSGRELIAAAAVQSRVVARIRIRYLSDVTAKHRVTHRGTHYNIDAVIPDPDSGVRYMTLLVYTGTNDG